MEEQPKYFYIFCDTFNWLTNHNLKITKTFTSSGFTQALTGKASLQLYKEGKATYLPFVKGQPTVQFVSPFQINVMNQYRVEHDAEMFRLLHFPLAPSRLSATYAFGDIATCEVVAQKHKWDLKQVKKFMLLPHELNRVTKVNMEIVSLARGVYNRASWPQEDIENLWNHYWAGQGDLSVEIPGLQGQREPINSGLIWEYLIEGSLRLAET